MRLPLSLALLLTVAHAQPVSITGIPTVTDGDTLQIRGVKVRLYGIDAPESSQQCLRNGKVYGCGREAAFALADLVRNRSVTCLRKDTDRYGRMVGVCTVGGVEVNRFLVERGWALPYVQYGGQVYAGAEAGARAAKRGLHAGTFQNPWEYRRNPANPTTAGTPRAAPSAGNVSYRNCAEVRAAGAAPIRKGQPGYGAHLDRDGNGIACKK